ncbi:23S rRNA (guanosine(2251)-2'-O)-methyltransferase RlmB [Varunaivibrio sulfuroxidans]|uniref:23S rRNA (Guanosine2251-2'-O)-methyltransferase n=1 Tax=Varunaivibrio sulfuroxidans TaxID=1773489 RepID=A0A4R3JCI6_9PROT|nr:23S rRNA (guanosine(2251)-2'-O)-methyltransferase RlmB [Varunaivibrio sulfuroxidans]TCS63384.1 23S rRNA (guanosine2251-2'-O)-methyltransferase [Varunaivibrio sulfuroxidans]WES30468.1 23S rRNA (guanosine(2251)-2'-O)-methyltransferase RlmB [Varunaivibrio sulfuroxidans]
MAKRKRRIPNAGKPPRHTADNAPWPPHGRPDETVGAPREGTHARTRGALWLYGVHAALAALANPQRVIYRVVTSAQSSLDGDANGAAEIGETNGAAARPKAEIRDRREIDALLPPHAVHQGIAVQAEMLPVVSIEDLCHDLRREPATAGDTAGDEARRQHVVVVLDQATDPQNIGAVIRSAAAFGAAGVVIHDRHAPDVTGAMAKAASGGVEKIPLVRVTNLARALDYLKGAGFWCVGLDGHTDKMLTDGVLEGGDIALVLGAEGQGLRRLTLETCDLVAKIPMSDAIESLNLSNAAAIALYEFARTRRT